MLALDHIYARRVDGAGTISWSCQVCTAREFPQGSLLVVRHRTGTDRFALQCKVSASVMYAWDEVRLMAGGQDKMKQMISRWADDDSNIKGPFGNETKKRQ